LLGINGGALEIRALTVLKHNFIIDGVVIERIGSGQHSGLEAKFLQNDVGSIIR
jgi:hypothetical protein